MKPLRHRCSPFSFTLSLGVALAFSAVSSGATEVRTVQLETRAGVLEGVVEEAGLVDAFKGIPYAAPPVGGLRWQPPRPAAPWAGLRLAHDFPPRAMQVHLWDDMRFFDDGPSEDCLYLNVWRPAKAAAKKRPVMFWIHGGGFVAGSTSEPRQNGAKLTQKGVVVVSLTYRMGVLGFLAHPELSEESPQGASGNYGLMDMVAALEWVRDNIADFGGDPDNVTIFGESAGSFAVSMLMASPMAEGLFHKAIGESGAALGEATLSLKEGEEAGTRFGQEVLGLMSLRELRELPAQDLIEAAGKEHRFRAVVDGRFLMEDVEATYQNGRQNSVPLLAGWNLDEGGAGAIFGQQAQTLVNFEARAREQFGADADEFLAAYAATTDAEALRAAKDYGGDRFIGHGTWRWIETHQRTGGKPVFRYRFDQTLPLPVDAAPQAEPRAAHSWEIEYVFGVISSRDLPWRPEDHEVSDLMMNYWTNFAKRGDPNGAGVPAWPQYLPEDQYPVMHLQADPVVTFDDHRDRYEFMTNQMSD